MWRLEAERSLNILLTLNERLTGQGIHHIDVERLEIHCGLFNRCFGLHTVVYTAKRFEMRIIEALHANGQTRHARLAESLEAVFLKCAGIGF